ncbi:MAG: heat-inducible transcriptional repressor HrcA [Alphaproteobacteria bacterium]|mgnify:CR=1 FL=1|nr:heat-inducible transcriptional repressor HrcA [Alphaproteobacteria bacterium]MDX5370683.1 heat-inducible transcriptional repressor HrcA [Alphaproteobacteria bacterium]MDX5465109.1 heat-inducible transcriptional repressor HrcA [Alphaproteobacteria bacterium]
MRLRTPATIEDLRDRPREIFRHIVETYLDTGAPVGSRTLSHALSTPLSAASIRNVMQDLEAMGLLYAPHTSAGRMPTEIGLRLFVDGLLEVGDLTDEERSSIDAKVAARGHTYEDLLTEAISMLSGLSRCAGLVMSPKVDSALKHIEFVPLNARSALVVLVTAEGMVENRVVDLPPGLPPAALIEATNYLNARIAGRTLEDARRVLDGEIEAAKKALDALTAAVVETGLATWVGSSGDAAETAKLLVRGQSNLLEDIQMAEDLDRIRLLFEELETKTELVRLLELARDADGVKVYIGSETKLFSLSGSSLVIAPYRNAQQRVIGAIGVIGPTRINYARIVPMVDYTARVVSRLLARD